MTHGHRHDHDYDEEMSFRVGALERILIEKGLVDPAALDELIDT